MHDSHAHSTNVLRLRTQAIEYEVFNSLSNENISLRAVISAITSRLEKLKLPLTEISSDFALKKRVARLRSTNYPAIKNYHELGILVRYRLEFSKVQVSQNWKVS